MSSLIPELMHMCSRTYVFVFCFEAEKTSDKTANGPLSGVKVEEDEVLKQKKKQFPGLAISDNPERARSLLEPTEDEKVTWEAMHQVLNTHPPC